MTRDSQTKLSKKEQNRRSKKQDELNKKKRRNDTSDSDNDDINSDSENENEDDINIHEFRKFLSKTFPSKYINKKIKAGEKLKKVLEDDEVDNEDSYSSEEEKINKKSKKNKKNNKNKKVIESDTEEDEEEEWETASEDESEKVNKSKKHKKNRQVVQSDTEDEEESEEYEEDQDVDVKPNKNKLNIILTIGGANEEDEWNSEDDYDSDYEDYEDSASQTENEDDSVSSDSQSEEDEDEDEEIEKPKNKLNKKEKEDTSNTEEKKSSNEVLSQLKDLMLKNKHDKSIQKCVEVYEESIKKQNEKSEKKVKKHKAKNMRIFRRIMRDKNTMNDFSFYEKLEIENQKKLIKELREINKITRVEKPYRMTLLESDIPVQFKAAAMKKINTLRYMEPGSGEFYKIKNWVDTFMRIPFTKTEGLPISIDDGVEKCHDFMEIAQKTLDSAVYGLNDAKMQIMQMLGQLLTNPKSIGTAIAIHGPPGTGKTSLVKEGISKILNRPFAFIALGGATDSSFLEGHGYTYEGSTWGKIVQILIDSKCMNPVIYFDELDKISDTPRGEEIVGILTHLTDTSQNSQFHDKYFAEINFDLSKCLFIFSYNDESKVNPILKDRMYRIQTKGYNQKQKTIIGNNYLLPKIREQVRFNEGEIIIPDETIHYLIDNHCNKEDGVRNLKRCLEIIYTKLNLYRLMKPGSNLFEEDMSLKVEFPFTVTKDIVDKLIKIDKGNISALYSMYV